MYAVLAPGADFARWRALARSLVLQGIPPEQVTWLAGTPSAGRDATPAHEPVSDPAFTVPAGFLDLARAAVLHRGHAHFALLYRLLWRLRADPALIGQTGDADLMALHRLAGEVRRDQRRMTAGLRFREIGRERSSRCVAWFEPAHHILEATAPFFERRYADMAWSILTPERCAHWDGVRTVFTAGITKPVRPAGDPLEELWRRYVAQLPARGGTSPSHRRLVP